MSAGPADEQSTIELIDRLQAFVLNGREMTEEEVRQALCELDTLLPDLAPRLTAVELTQGLDRLADKLVSQALAGDQWAILEIGNCLDGKPAQEVMLAPDLQYQSLSPCSSAPELA